MANFSINQEMKRIKNEEFLKKADLYTPVLHKKSVCPTRIISMKTDEIKEINKGDQTQKYSLQKGDELILDFGNHQVGYVTLKLHATGSPQDSPAYFRLQFGEMAGELKENSAEYTGWLSRSWIQEEYIHVDVLPAEISLPRRYAFRYLKIEVLDTSPKWQMVVDSAVCQSVSAVNDQDVTALRLADPELIRIDQVSLRTLHNCMQTVFEDGPKRDRRLWIGDLRLQALADYETFKNLDLVKRCLYLFAGTTRADGRIGACVFTEPEYLVDDTILLDYALFFAPILYDYYQASGDLETLKELWPSALKQITLTQSEFDDRNVIKEGEGFWCFIDWKEGLNKQTSLQAIYIYCVRRALKIAEILNLKTEQNLLQNEIKEKTGAAMQYLWDAKKQLFISGSDRQISYASQVWMILAEVTGAENGKQILDRLDLLQPEYNMVSPYMNHHYAEALIFCGEKEKALRFIKDYWGGMIRLGADTFWELYNPDNPQESPYGSTMVNSYCHAWSCTPTYLLRKYYQ